MKERWTWIFVVGSAVVLWALGTLAGGASSEIQQPNTLTEREKAAGWKLLFDGRTMRGWHDPRQMQPPGDGWTVEDGCLRTLPNPRIREDLISEEKFGDFELEFEWKLSARGNSGVKYLVQDQVVLEEGKLNPQARRFEDLVEYELRERKSGRGKIEPNHRAEVYVIGFEYQLIDEGHPDARRGPDRRTGAIYSLLAPQQPVECDVARFNRSRIVLRGEQVEHWLNGVKILEARLDSEEIRKKVAARWGEDSAVGALLIHHRRPAPIALQHHNDVVWFRNIKIRPL